MIIYENIHMCNNIKTEEAIFWNIEVCTYMYTVIIKI